MTAHKNNVSTEMWCFLVVAIFLPYFLRTIQCFLKFDILKYFFFSDCKNCCLPSIANASDNSHNLLAEQKAEDTILGFLVRKVHFHGENIQRSDYMGYSYVLQSARMFVSEIHQCSWVEARVAYGWSQNVAVFVGGVRFIFFHLLQPVAFSVAVAVYFTQLDDGQQGCMMLVLFNREIYYVISLLLAAVLRPSFLLVNLNITTLESLHYEPTSIRCCKYPHIFAYITYPTMYVTNVAWGLCDNGPLWIWLCAIASDISAFVSIGFAIVYHDLPLPLLIHIGMIVFAWVGGINLWFYTLCYEKGNIKPDYDDDDIAIIRVEFDGQNPSSAHDGEEQPLIIPSDAESREGSSRMERVEEGEEESEQNGGEEVEKYVNWVKNATGAAAEPMQQV